jgi:hypothetical protein
MFSTTKDARSLKQAAIPHPSHRSIGPSPFFSTSRSLAGREKTMALRFLRPTALRTDEKCTAVRRALDGVRESRGGEPHAR